MERLRSRHRRGETLDLGFSSTYIMATISSGKTGPENMETQKT